MSLVNVAPEKLRKLRPAMYGGRKLGQEEIEVIFKACGAFWFHPGEADPTAPHAQLTSGKCSNGFISCPEVLENPNLCEVMALQMVMKLREVYNGPVDWVVGSDSAALGLSYEVARTLGVKWHPMQKGPDKTQVWEKKVMPAGAVVLQVEELITTSETAKAVRAGIRNGNPNPVTFVPFLPALVWRPAQGETNVVEDSKILSVTYYEIWAADQKGCPLCQAGSERLRPRDGNNWAILTARSA